MNCCSVDRDRMHSGRGAKMMQTVLEEGGGGEGE